MPSENKDSLDHLFECGICTELKPLRVLKCGHSYCGECLQTLATKVTRNRVCPTCRSPLPTEFDVSQLPINYNLSSARDIVNDRVSNMESTMKSMASAIKSMESTMESLTLNMDEKIQAKLDKAMAEVDKAMDEETSRLNEKIEKLETDMIRLVKEIKEKDAEITRLSNENTHLRTTNEEKDDQLLKAHESRRLMETELADTKQKLAQAQKSWIQKLWEHLFGSVEISTKQA